MYLSKLNFRNASRIITGFYMILTAFFIKSSSILLRFISFSISVDFNLSSFSTSSLKHCCSITSFMVCYLSFRRFIFSSSLIFFVSLMYLSFSKLSRFLKSTFSSSIEFTSCNKMDDILTVSEIISLYKRTCLLYSRRSRLKRSF